MLRELSIRGVDRECFIDPTPLYPGELSQSEMATVAGGAAIGAALALVPLRLDQELLHRPSR